MGFLHCHVERPTGYPHCHVERPMGVETSLYKSLLKISPFASLSRYDSVRHISHYHPQKPSFPRMTPSFYRHHPQKPLISRMTPSIQSIPIPKISLLCTTIIKTPAQVTLEFHPTLTTTNIIPKSGVEESIFLHCHIERPTDYLHCHVERPTGVETSLHKSLLKISPFASLSRYDSVRHISHYHPQKPLISRMTPSFYRHHPQKPLISRMTPSFYRHHPQKPPFPRMSPSL